MFAASPDVHSALGHLPLRFESAPDGRLVAREGPYSLTVEPGRTTVTVADRTKRQTATVTTTLVGAEATSRPVGADPLAAKANYLLGDDPAAWRSGAPLFSRVVYHGVYRGIDLVFHGDGGSLEYDFVVRPGASARRIALDVTGAVALHLESDGSLAISTPAGEIRWKKPEVYQQKEGVRQTVAGAFRLRGQRLTFDIGTYDRTRELIIDPTLTYATYLGGNDNDASRGVAVDGAGNFYVTGFTYSMNFPVTSAALQTAYHGGSGASIVGGDAFVAKYTAAGALSYVTYLGGSNDDCGSAIAVDSAGNAYVTGFTTSTDFPTVKGSFQTTFGGAGRSDFFQLLGDAFVAKLNPAGTALVYSTYLGGSNDEQGTAIAVDSSGNAYVGGSTLSTNFPTSNAYQKTFGGSGGSPGFEGPGSAPFMTFGDGFITKLNSTGTGVIFSTYFGGELDDAVSALAVDTSGNVYVGGNTLSTKFPVLNAYQSKYGGAAGQSAQPVIAAGDGFVAKFGPTGTLAYSTYLGGSADDAVMALAVDSTGAAYVTGFTSSANFPVSATAAQKSFAGPANITPSPVGGDYRGFVWGDAFITKLAPSGSSLAWSTYLGGNQDDAGMAIAVDGANNAIVGGFANSTNLPVTSNAQQSAFGGNGPAGYTDPTGDAFLAKVSADGTTFQYLSYYGGNSSDVISAVALDASGDVIAGGCTTSTNLPVTAKATQSGFAGQDANNATEAMGDAFVAVFSGIATAGGGSPPTAVVVNDAENGASFATEIVPNAWLTIKGTNLSTVTDTWNNSIVNGVLPTILDGVTVKVGGQSAYISYVSPGQINAVAPNIPAGSTSVTVTNSIGTSAAVNFTAQIFGPAFFLWPGGYAIATRQDFSYAVKNGTFPGLTTVPAKPGDVLILWGTGFGPTNPAAPVGVAVPLASYPTANNVTVTVGGVNAQVYGAALASAAAALYQVAIQVPTTLANGDYPVVATVSGVASPVTTLLTVQQ